VAVAVIVDTTGVVTRLITADARSPVARVLDGMLAAAWPFAVSKALPGALPTAASMAGRVLSPSEFITAVRR
jgi:hypothetical protein